VEYENPKIDETINLPTEHPLKEFTILLTGVAAFALVTFYMLILLADYATRYIPFSFEQTLMDQLEQFSALEQVIGQPGEERVEQYLQALADELAITQQIPDSMSITVHYIETPELNAYATLGGHIYLFSGLLASCDNENTLAMILSHEIAHVHHRHPIVALGRGFTIAVATLSVLGASNSDISHQLLNRFGLATQLSFSRQHEIQADDTALETLQRHYGHVGGAERLFDLIGNADENPLNTLLSTHPLTDQRRQNITAFSDSQTSNEVPLIKLPAWLNEKRATKDR
jgi:predicted Zn-dependent protease